MKNKGGRGEDEWGGGEDEWGGEEDVVTYLHRSTESSPSTSGIDKLDDLRVLARETSGNIWGFWRERAGGENENLGDLVLTFFSS